MAGQPEFRKIGDTGIAEVISEAVLINTGEDGLDLLGNAYYQGYDKMILSKENFSPAFFDLKNGLAGEVLQKFSNYRVRLVIVGDFSDITSRALNDFIRESNRSTLVNFLQSREEAIERLTESH